jgi:hypothetical protein
VLLLVLLPAGTGRLPVTVARPDLGTVARPGTATLARPGGGQTVKRPDAATLGVPWTR